MTPAVISMATEAARAGRHNLPPGPNPHLNAGGTGCGRRYSPRRDAMSARTVAPAISHLKHPHSRGTWDRIKHWLLADPPLSELAEAEVTWPAWIKFWTARAVRYIWLRRDISPGIILAAVLWLWTRSPITFGPHPPRLPAVAILIVAGIVGYWSLRHRDAASDDRRAHRVKRAIQTACLDCGIRPVPAIHRPDTSRPHVTLVVMDPIQGTDEHDLAMKVVKRARSALKAPVRYKQNENGTGILSVHHHDPLTIDPELPAYLGNDHGPKLRPTWRALPFAKDANDDLFTLNLHQQHLLIGGQTGSGKTSSADALAISCLAAPDVEVVAIAPERASFGFLRGLVDGYAETPADALVQMREEHKLLEKRDAMLDELDTSLLNPSPRHPLHVIFVDELQNLLDEGIQGKKYVEEFKTYLIDILNRGRKRAITVVGITTNPRKTVLTDGIRDQFTYRLSFRVADQAAASMVMGDSKKGFEPDELPKGKPGRAVLKSDDHYQLYTFRVWDRQARQAAQAVAEPRPEPVRTFDPPSSLTPVDGTPPPIDVGVSDVLPFRPVRARGRRDQTREEILAYCVSHARFNCQEIADAVDCSYKTVLRWFQHKTNPIVVRHLGGGVYELVR